MPAATRPRRIDDLMEEASKALADTKYFAAERLAAEALGLARQASDFECMARIVLPLQEARRQRYHQALDVGVIRDLEQPFDEEMTVEPGCYLVQPPRVGAEARRLRLLALEQEVPAAVVCREPITQLKLWPVVAIGPGVTMRTKLDPPDDPEAPDLAWFAEALEILGDFAIDTIDPGLAVLKRVDLLLGRSEAIPEHEELHQVLAATCREAAEEAAREAAEGGSKKSRSRRK